MVLQVVGRLPARFLNLCTFKTYTSILQEELLMASMNWHATRVQVWRARPLSRLPGTRADCQPDGGASDGDTKKHQTGAWGSHMPRGSVSQDCWSRAARQTLQQELHCSLQRLCGLGRLLQLEQLRRQRGRC